MFMEIYIYIYTYIYIYIYVKTNIYKFIYICIYIYIYMYMIYSYVSYLYVDEFLFVLPLSLSLSLSRHLSSICSHVQMATRIDIFAYEFTSSAVPPCSPLPPRALSHSLFLSSGNCTQFSRSYKW